MLLKNILKLNSNIRYIYYYIIFRATKVVTTMLYGYELKIISK